ncbi:nicotinamide-nucleotide adenylyltransferase [Saccharolobus islandicus]|uniref:Nicotinamide-nucleotide adenylyltransferase n=1 Tax=Saccharolobus islandicus LAL14/1 TaxID=1241935 RepID=M9UEZ1_SACIS|nr:nicotinamide-nucleotide adenylyltransferase [Sulfolobus islandicus]AGJ63181.1 nicotinamide-nucleotide adenylyltransferase [Sulfolobus islandicus LAL14/1]
MSRGLYPGRFQPFHLGHLNVIKWSLERVDELIILVGSSQESHTVTNPFTAGERVEMIRNSLKYSGIDLSRIFIIPMPDILMNNIWAHYVSTYTPKFEVVFARNPLVVRIFKEAGYKVEIPPPFNREKYNSTYIRRLIILNDNWSELVPEPVYKYILHIHGDQRLREIVGTDK